MISLEIISAGDPNLLGIFTFCKSLIYIGSNHQSDIYLPDSNLSDIHFFIEIIEDKLILHLNQKAEPILVNTKRTTHFKNIKTGDIISADGIEFKVLNFKDEKIFTKKEVLNKAVENLQQDNPELLKIITSLSELS